MTESVKYETTVKLVEEDGVRKSVVEKRKVVHQNDAPEDVVDDDDDDKEAVVASSNKRSKATTKGVDQQEFVFDSTKTPMYFHLIITYEGDESKSYYAPLGCRSVSAVKNAIRNILPIKDQDGYPVPACHLAACLSNRIHNSGTSQEEDLVVLVRSGKKDWGTARNYFVDGKECPRIRVDTRDLISDEELPLWKTGDELFSLSEQPEHLEQTFMLSSWC